MTASPDLPAGTLLRGKYRLQRVLGRGGMGMVYEATHLDLERRVAIKLLHAELRSEPDVVERFVREGRAASRIEGEHVARILDVDRLEDGTPFLVMEYLDGTDLSTVRTSGTPLPVREAIDYVVQACAGISQAHARGIIHRDIKPANLFLARLPDGSSSIRVLDFGISKMVSGADTSTTKTSVIMGSPDYMSPEQLLSTRDVDERSDIWALGVTLFELLTASVPFVGENATQVCAMVMTQRPPNPRSLRPEIPESVARVVLRCLERERDMRFAGASELSTALTASLADVEPEDAFEVTVDGEAVVAPVTRDQVRRGLAAGKIEADARVRRVGERSWSPVADLVSETPTREPSPIEGAQTNAAVTSAIPEPPRRRSLGLVAVSAVFGVIAVGVVIFVVSDRRHETNVDGGARQGTMTSETRVTATNSAPTVVVSPSDAAPPSAHSAKELNVSDLPDFVAAPSTAGAPPRPPQPPRSPPTSAPSQKPPPPPPPTAGPRDHDI